MLSINQLEKQFGGRMVLATISMTFKPGCIYVLTGANGSGKTTLLDLISGFVLADSGTISLDGERLNRLPPYQRSRRGIGRMFQHSRGFSRLTLLDNLLVAASEQPGNNPFRLHWKRAEGENRLLAYQYLKTVGLQGRAEAWVRDLSFGERKLIAFGRLMMGTYRVLLLDEPFAGLGSNVRAVLESRILKARHQGLAIVLVEHERDVSQRLADIVLQLESGHLTQPTNE